MNMLPLAAADGPFARLFDGSGLIGHPLILAALIIGGILAITKFARIDLTFLIPLIEIPLRLLLSASPNPTQVVASQVASTVNTALSPLALAIRSLADRLDPPKPPTPAP